VPVFSSTNNFILQIFTLETIVETIVTMTVWRIKLFVDENTGPKIIKVKNKR